jgi:hypothetical protein
MNSSFDETKSLFNNWKQQRVKFSVIFKGVSLGFGFIGFVADVSEKGTVTLAEIPTPSPETPAAILVQLRLLDLTSRNDVDIDRLQLPAGLSSIPYMVNKSWTFTFKAGERVVMHQLVAVS